MMWTKFVKVIAYITLVFGIIGSLIAAAIIANDSVALSLGIFIGGILASAISVSMLMVIVEISENTAACRDYLFRIKGGQANLEPSINSDNTSENTVANGDYSLGIKDEQENHELSINSNNTFEATHKLRLTAYLREAPSRDSNGIVLLNIDSLVSFRKEEKNKAIFEKPWYLVVTKDNIAGWIPSDNLEKLKLRSFEID